MMFDYQIEKSKNTLKALYRFGNEMHYKGCMKGFVIGSVATLSVCVLGGVILGITQGFHKGEFKNFEEES